MVKWEVRVLNTFRKNNALAKKKKQKQKKHTGMNAVKKKRKLEGYQREIWQYWTKMKLA